jgi:DNA polymerase-3 subunit epsilon
MGTQHQLFVKHMNPNGPVNIAVVDFETTGLEPKQDKIIDGAIILSEFSIPENTEHCNGRMELIESYHSFNDPGFPLPENIKKLTKIKDEDVKGHVFNWKSFWDIADHAHIILAHNMAFDSSFMQGVTPERKKKFACTLDMIDWNAMGMTCRKLSHLCFELGLSFNNSILHGALADSNLLNLLLVSNIEESPIWKLMVKAKSERWFICKAIGAPFQRKDFLKQYGFQWNGADKYWYKTFPESKRDEIEGIVRQCYDAKPTHRMEEVA